MGGIKEELRGPSRDAVHNASTDVFNESLVAVRHVATVEGKGLADVGGGGQDGAGQAAIDFFHYGLPRFFHYGLHPRRRRDLLGIVVLFGGRNVHCAPVQSLYPEGTFTVGVRDNRSSGHSSSRSFLSSSRS